MNGPKTRKCDKVLGRMWVSHKSMQNKFGESGGPSFYYTLATAGQLGFDVDGRTTTKLVVHKRLCAHCALVPG